MKSKTYHEELNYVIHLYMKREKLKIFFAVGLYWQETSMTSVGIRFRHNIGSCLLGIIFSLLNVIICCNEVSYIIGVRGTRD